MTNQLRFSPFLPPHSPPREFIKPPAARLIPRASYQSLTVVGRWSPSPRRHNRHHHHHSHRHPTLVAITDACRSIHPHTPERETRHIGALALVTRSSPRLIARAPFNGRRTRARAKILSLSLPRRDNSGSWRVRGLAIIENRCIARARRARDFVRRRSFRITRYTQRVSSFAPI